MFDDYLEDAYALATQAKDIKDERVVRKYYRASIFYAMSAIEAFINYLADSFAHSNRLKDYELGFLKDMKFGYANGKIKEVYEHHNIEDKLKFLIYKFCPNLDLATDPSWGNFTEFKKFRNTIVHPREEEDTVTLSDYKNQLAKGISSIIEIMNHLCKGILGQNLRKGLLELKTIGEDL